MSLKRPTENSKRKISLAVALVAMVLISGTYSITSVFAETKASPNLNVSAVSPLSQLSLAEWSVPTPAAIPWGIALDVFAKVWITENSTSKLARFDPSNNNFTEWNIPATGSQPRNIFVKQVVSFDGTVNVTQVFFSEYASNAIGRFDSSNNTFTEWPLGARSNPVGIYVDENNDIWFAESGRDIIGRLSPSSNVLTEWTLPGATTSPGSPLLKPWGIYVQVVPTPAGSNRFVWFTQSASNKIGRLEANSNRLTTWDLNGRSPIPSQPTDITSGFFNTAPSVFFTSAVGGMVSILGNDTGIARSSNYRASIIPSNAPQPTSMTFDARRNALWFAENNVGNVAYLNTTTVISSQGLTASYCTIPPAAGTPSCLSPATKTSLVTPTVTLNAAGSSQIQNPVQPSPSVISAAYYSAINGLTEYPLPNRAAKPSYMALDSSGNLWFTESDVTVNRIGRLNVPFQVSAFPTVQTVNQGQTATYAVNVTLPGGSPLPVQLTLLNAPAGVTAKFNPQLQKPPFVSTLTIATTNSTPTGTFPMNVQASFSGQNQIAHITLTVNAAPQSVFDFTITLANPTSVTITQGQAASFNLQIALTSGTPQSVNLTATGFPPGTTYSLTNPSGLPTFSSRLDVQTSVDTPAGSYQITVTGLSRGGVPHHPAVGPVLVITELPRDFNLTSPVNQILLVQGSRTDVPVTVTSVGLFGSNVTFDGAFSPPASGLGVFFSPSPVVPQPNGGAAQTTMEIIASKHTTGTYQLTITGTSSNPSRSHQIVLSVRVSPCLIATASFGSELAPEVQFLRDFRDQQIVQTFAGSNFMEVFNAWYYSFSPAVAQYEYSHATTRTIVKVALYPLIATLHLASSSYALIEFEPEVAAMVAGLVGSSLIGLAYLASPLSVILWLNRSRINAKTKRRVAKWMAVIFAVLMAGFVVSELFALSAAMMVASAGLVLTTLLAGGVLPAFEIVGYARRRA